jgi:hypothetical protein
MKNLEFELFVENCRVKLIIFASFRSNYILLKNMAAKLIFRSPPFDHHVYRVIHRIFRRDCPHCCYENQLQGDACQWYGALPIHQWFQQRRYSTVNDPHTNIETKCRSLTLMKY